jgi:hypothetical protein
VGHADREFRQIHLAIADEDAAGCRRENTGHHFDKGGLSSAIIADEADDFVAPDGDVNLAERVHGTEKFVDLLQPNDELKVLLSGSFVGNGWL